MNTPMWTRAHVVRHRLEADAATGADHLNRSFTLRVLVEDDRDRRPDQRGWAPPAILGDANVLSQPERPNRNRDLGALNLGRIDS